MSRPDRTEVRGLRRQMREWRRGRADTTLREVLSDAYIAVFATVMIGAMTISAVIQTSSSVSEGCTTALCEDSRSGLGWTGIGAIITVVLVVARIVGPLQVSPAIGAWMLSAPVSRATVLRPRLYALTATVGLGTGVIAAGVAEVAGLAPSGVAVYAVAVAAGSTVAVLVACLAQTRRTHAVRLVTWVLGGATWSALLAIALDRAPDAPSSPVGGSLPAVVGTAALWVLGIGLVVVDGRRLDSLRHDRLVPGGSLLAGLSGALASLDLSLMYDILIARRWLTASTVRPVRGGPSGVWALVWRDVVRLRRSGASLVVLAAGVVVPYVAVAVDLGGVVALVGALTIFAAGLALCTALRTTTRTPALVRCFPMTATEVRAACLTVPAVVVAAWSAAAVPAIHEGLAIAWDDAAAVSLATGAAGITAIARWLTAPPPDYGKPLVASPAGAVPTGLIGSVLRGFDVLALLVAPVLIAPDANGATVSLGLAAVVLAVLLRREQVRPA